MEAHSRFSAVCRISGEQSAMADAMLETFPGWQYDFDDRQEQLSGYRPKGRKKLIDSSMDGLAAGDEHRYL